MATWVSTNPFAELPRELTWFAGGAAAVVSAALAIAKLRLPYVLHAILRVRMLPDLFLSQYQLGGGHSSLRKLARTECE